MYIYIYIYVYIYLSISLSLYIYIYTYTYIYIYIYIYIYRVLNVPKRTPKGANTRGTLPKGPFRAYPKWNERTAQPAL